MLPSPLKLAPVADNAPFKPPPELTKASLTPNIALDNFGNA